MLIGRGQIRALFALLKGRGGPRAGVKKGQRVRESHSRSGGCKLLPFLFSLTSVLSRSPANCVALILILALTTTGAPALAATAFREMRELTILAPHSLTEPLAEITRLYARRHDTAISLSLGSPLTHVSQIITGEPADLILTDDAAQLQRLEYGGLLDVYSIIPLAESRTALITASPEVARTVRLREDQTLAYQLMLAPGTPAVVIADEKRTALGQVTREQLEEASEWSSLEPFMVRVGDSHEIISQVLHRKRLGVTYLSDARRYKDIHILHLFPPSASKPLLYKGAVVAGENMETAREFLKFLHSSTARAVFERYGFTLPVLEVQGKTS